MWDYIYSHLLYHFFSVAGNQVVLNENKNTLEGKKRWIRWGDCCECVPHGAQALSVLQQLCCPKTRGLPSPGVLWWPLCCGALAHLFGWDLHGLGATCWAVWWAGLGEVVFKVLLSSSLSLSESAEGRRALSSGCSVCSAIFVVSKCKVAWMQLSLCTSYFSKKMHQAHYKILRKHVTFFHF